MTDAWESVAWICDIQFSSTIHWSNLILENDDIIKLARIMRMKKTFWEHFWLPKLCFQIMGIIHLSGPQAKWKIVLAKFLILGPIISANWVLYEQLYFLVDQNPTNDEIIKIMMTLLPTIVIQCRAMIVIFNSIRLKRLLTLCEDLWNNSTPQEYSIIFRWASRSHIIIKVCITSSVMLSSSYLLIALVKQFTAPSDGTGRYSLFSVRKIFTPSPLFEFYIAVQVILSFYLNIALASYDMLGPFMALNMCGQMDLMEKWLVDISKELSKASNLKFEGSVKMSVAKVIRKHQGVLEFCAQLEEVNRYSTLIKIMDSLYVMALTASRIMASTQLGFMIWYTVAAMYSACGIFYVCWPGDMLSNSCSKIAKAVYEIPWYKLSKSDKKIVIIMLAQCQNPVVLTAGKFVDLSLKTFSAVMSNAMSIYLILRNL